MDDFVEHLQKRVRNLQKRKQRLDRYAELAASEPGSLNADQLAALDHRDSVEAPLKELTDLMAQYRSHVDTYASIEAEKVAEAERKGRTAGEEAAQHQLTTVLKFLHVAALKHQSPVPVDPKELLSVDLVLEKLYLGSPEAEAAAEKLVNGVAEAVGEEEGVLTWAQVRTLSVEPVSITSTEEQPHVVTEEQTQPTISFLQEDELAYGDAKMSNGSASSEAKKPAPKVEPKETKNQKDTKAVKETKEAKETKDTKDAKGPSKSQSRAKGAANKKDQSPKPKEPSPKASKASKPSKDAGPKSEDEFTPVARKPRSHQDDVKKRPGSKPRKPQPVKA